MLSSMVADGLASCIRPPQPNSVISGIIWYHHTVPVNLYYNIPDVGSLQ